MIVVVGMAFEARIAAGLGVPVICGGDGRHLAAFAARAPWRPAAAASSALALRADLRPASGPAPASSASAILDDAERRANRCALGAAPDAHHSRMRVHGPILRRARADRARGREAATCTRQTGAIAVDMESHVVARAAAQHGVPFAAIRVMVDPVERTIPRSALAGSRPDGTIDPLAVMRSLVRYPRDLLGLMRMSFDARAARATLVRGRERSDPALGCSTPRCACRAAAHRARSARSRDA